MSIARLGIANGDSSISMGAQSDILGCFIDSSQDLSISTMDTVRLKLDTAGIVVDNLATDVLALSPGDGVSIVKRNNFPGGNTPEVLMNKTIDSGDNTITITRPGLIAENINNIIDQQLKTTDNVGFGSVSTLGGVFAGSGCQGGFGHFDTINSQAVDNTCTVNGVNPLTTDTNLNAHIGSSIVHGATGAVVGTTNTQLLTNKSLSDTSTSIVDSVDNSKRLLFDVNGSSATSTTLTAVQTANRVLTFPDASDTLVARNTTDTLTNKSVDSGSNTITLTNVFLTGVDVNNVLGQAVRPIDSPSFAGLSLTGIANNNGVSDILALNGSSVVYKNNIADTSSVQTFTNKNLSDSTTAIVDVGDATKRILFDAAGNTGTSTTLTSSQLANAVLTLPASTTSLIGNDTINTLSNKTIDSGSNTLSITNSPLSGANVNTLINQDVRTSAGPTFTTFVHLTQAGNASFEITGKGNFCHSGSAGAFFTNSATGDINVRQDDSTKSLNLGVSNATAQLQISNTITKNVVTSVDDYVTNTLKAKSVFPISTTSAAGATTILLTVPVPTNTSVSIFMYFSTRKLTGTITGYGSYIYDWKALNNAGTVTVTNGSNQAKSETAVAGAFAGKITPTATVSTTNVNINLANTFVDGTLIEAGYIEVLFS